ncbi:MAG: hypothetical protein HY751_10265 [Nitrospinae bacterium]|nr:hypothetical protein [Nitrospinota bacterium]
MNELILIQLAVDVLLFAIVIIYVIRDGKSKAMQEHDELIRQIENQTPPSQADVEAINTLMNELARLVMRAEKVADRLEKGATNAMTAEPAPARAGQGAKPAPIPPAPVNPPQSMLDEDTYTKAAKLIKKGLPDDEIGKKVGLPPHEVSLIRKMAT